MPIPYFFKKEMKNMFECAEQMFIQLLEWAPGVVVVYILFDLLRGLIWKD